MIAQQIDLQFQNNTDWNWLVVFYDGPGGTPPWTNVAEWQEGVQYQSYAPADVVTYNGDLYVANPLTPQVWTSAATFSSEAANWQIIGVAANYHAVLHNMIGAIAKMTICELDPITGLIPSVPHLIVDQFTSDGSDASGKETITFPAPLTSGMVSLSIPKSRVSAYAPGVYGYDMIIGNQLACSGNFTIIEGATP